jgi:hypothetical protein
VGSNWLRGADLNRRPLGYECNHQQNLKTMRGAKSNALFSRRANRNPGCPCIALVNWFIFCDPVTAVKEPGQRAKSPLQDGGWRLHASRVALFAEIAARRSVAV